MREITIITLLYLLTFSTYLQVKAQEKRACLFTNGFSVHITSKLPPNAAPLELHCASKNDDLGTHTLSVGQEFMWDFCESFLARTLFYCDATWGSKSCGFQAFKSSWNARCDRGACYWEARSDGFYLSNFKDEPANYKKRADWK